jgi:hypothetical protein
MWKRTWLLFLKSFRGNDSAEAWPSAEVTQACDFYIEIGLGEESRPEEFGCQIDIGMTRSVSHLVHAV